MGSPDFAVPALRSLAQAYCIVGVVTQPDRPAGRGGALQSPAVKDTALQLGLPVIQPERLRAVEVLQQLHAWAPDVIIVAAYGQILRADVLDLPRHGCVNIHGSLLPRWRGAAPIQAAILAGDAQTGITIMRMNAGVDTGPILAQQAVPIEPGDTAGSLFERLAHLGADLLIDTLPAYLSGGIQPLPQTEDGATYAPLLKKDDGHLDFNQSAAALERRVRAMHPWPGATLQWQGAPLKVLKAHTDFLITTIHQPAGTRLIHQGLPAVYTVDHAMLVLDDVQPAGRKPMPGKAFLAGARDWAATFQPQSAS